MLHNLQAALRQQELDTIAPGIGRLSADLAVEGATSVDVTLFRLDRSAMTGPACATHWLV